MFGVSRIVIRQAVKNLEEKGYVTRKRGIGTIVNEKFRIIKIVNNQITNVEPLGETKFKSIIKIDANDKKHIKDFDPKHSIEKMEILKVKNDKPFVFIKAFIDIKFVDILNASTKNSYINEIHNQLYKSNIKDKLSYIKEKIYKENKDQYVMDQLKISDRNSYIVREYKGYTDSGKLMYYFRTYYVDENFKYEVIYAA
jgi:DNA-binding GntR family transcriptional regulator